MAVWCNLLPFGIVCGHLVHFPRFGMFWPRKIWQPSSKLSTHISSNILSNWKNPTRSLFPAHDPLVQTLEAADLRYILFVTNISDLVRLDFKWNWHSDCLGGIAQWLTREPHEPKIRVRIPPECTTGFCIALNISRFTTGFYINSYAAF
jgi:hypothetical protein